MKMQTEGCIDYISRPIRPLASASAIEGSSAGLPEWPTQKLTPGEYRSYPIWLGCWVLPVGFWLTFRVGRG